MKLKSSFSNIFAVVMGVQTYKVNLKFEQVLDLVKQLSSREKIKLSQELEKDIKEKKLTSFLEAFNTDEISPEEISEEVEAVRAELYARSKD